MTDVITTALIIAAVILTIVLGGRALERHLGTHIPIDLDTLDRPRQETRP